MKIPSSEDWGRLWGGVLTINSIIERAESSQYLQERSLQEFQQFLGRKRYVDDATGNVRAMLRSCRPNFHFFQMYASFSGLVQACPATSELFLNSYFESADQAAIDKPELDRVRTEEILHYASVFCQEIRNKEHYRGRDKESQVRALLQQILAAVRPLRNAEYGLSVHINVSRLRPTNPM
jgi:hypothetical protein